LNKIKLLETVKIENGKIFNIEFHNRRMNLARAELFNCTDSLDLAEHIVPGETGLVRCRIIYSDNIKSISLIPYEQKKFKSFRLMESGISYDYKFLDRLELDSLFSQKKEADDIIIVKNGLVTDTSIANIAFHDGKKWITPSNPLLRGTERERYIQAGQLIESGIKARDIKNFKKMALMNAMIDFLIIENPVFI